MGSVALAFQYECFKESGALLALQSYGDLEIRTPINLWVDYMARNYESWHEWARTYCDRDISHREIVLVHGCIKADDWYLASFSSKNMALQLAFSGETPYGEAHAAVGIRTGYITSPDRRKSSSFRTDPTITWNERQGSGNQGASRDCVFLVSLRMKTRHLWLQKFRRQPVSLETDSSKDWFSGGLDSSGGPSTSSQGNLTGGSASAPGQAGGPVDSDVAPVDTESDIGLEYQNLDVCRFLIIVTHHIDECEYRLNHLLNEYLIIFWRYAHKYYLRQAMIQQLIER